MDHSFQLAARVLLYAPSHRQDITYHGLYYTSHRALAGTRNSSMGPPRRIDPITHCIRSKHSYHRCTSRFCLDSFKPSYMLFIFVLFDIIFLAKMHFNLLYELICLMPYTEFKYLISQYIISTWQDDWNGAVANKLHSVKPVLGDWQSSYRRCRNDEVVLCCARIGHTYMTHSYILKKDPPTSV